MLRLIGSVTFLSLFMVGCGGGSSGGASSEQPPPPLITYSIGGTVTGLTGSGLMLQDNSGDQLPVSKAGAFAFANQLGSGASYTVTVQSQPSTPAQNCTVTNGSGTVVTANVTTVAVSCLIVAGYTVGGTVSGLVGSGLTLAICTRPRITHGVPTPDICTDQTQVHADGTYTLDAVYRADYAGLDYVFIAQQPSSPTQNCVISNAAVSTQAANETGFTVSCAEFAYVNSVAGSTLSAFSIDPTTGALAAIGTPTVTGAAPYATVGLEGGNPSYAFEGNKLTLIERKGYLFVGNEGRNGVSAFAVNSTTGALTEVPGSPFPAGTDPQALALLRNISGEYFLYVANAGSDNVSAYNIDVGTGALNPLSGPVGPTIATRKNPTSIAIGGQYNVSPLLAAPFIYVANHGGSNDISAFNSDLTPVPRSPFPAGGNPLSLAVGASGKFLYSANPDAANPSISGFSIDPTSGALSQLSGSPFPLPVSHYMATDQTGAYLYVTAGANIVGYAIDATTGALTKLPGFPVSAGADAYSVSIDPTNRFLYVANHGAATIAGFRLDASSGALTRISGSPFQAASPPDFIAAF